MPSNPKSSRRLALSRSAALDLALWMPIENRNARMSVRPSANSDRVVIRKRNFQERAAAARPCTRAEVTGDNPSSPGSGLRGLMPLTRVGNSSCVPPSRVWLTGLCGCSPRSSSGIWSMSVTT